MKDDAMLVGLILDRSGSMSKIEDAAVEGVNAFVAEQKSSSTETSIRFVQFDDIYEEVFDGAIGDAPTLTLQEKPGQGQARYEPRGGTALLDAIGRTIDEMGQRLGAMAESERPAKVVVVIMTDGKENASKKYNRERIFEMIAHQRDVYKWQFQFLGANQDAIATAATINIPHSNAINFASSTAGTRNVMRAASRNVRNYGATGQTVTMDYMAEDRARAMEEDPVESA